MSGRRSRAQPRLVAEPPSTAQQRTVLMSDGVRLATDVYLPESGGGAVLLVRLPYDKAGDVYFMPLVAEWFTRRGYVVVVQDTRGKGRSGGDVLPFVPEVDDARRTLDWICDQGFCTGSIGVFGDSYYGFTAWAAAATEHPALGAVAARVSTADFTTVVYRQGVFALEAMCYWALETWVDECAYDWDGQLDWSVRPQAEIVPSALGGRRPRSLDDWARGRDLLGAAVAVNAGVPALHLAGWDDLLLPQQLETWARAANGPAPQYLVIDGRDHLWTHRHRPAAANDWVTDPGRRTAFLDDYLGEMLPFFDHFLRGAGPYEWMPVRWRLADETWQQTDRWPHRDTRTETLFPDGARTLTPLPGRPRGAVTWRHDPEDPVPSAVHPFFTLVDMPDERDVVRRQDVAVWRTPISTTDEYLLGPVWFTGTVRSSGGSCQVVATVYDEFPSGRLRRLANGAAMGRAPWPATVEVDLGAVGWRLGAGHRLCLVVSGSSFPKFVLHPGTDEEPWYATAMQSIVTSLEVGGPTGAQLIINVLPESEKES